MLKKKKTKQQTKQKLRMKPPQGIEQENVTIDKNNQNQEQPSSNRKRQISVISK